MNKAALHIGVEVLCAHGFPFLLRKYPGVRLLGYMVSECSTLCEDAKLFFKVFHTLHFLQQCVQILVAPYSCGSLLLSVFFPLALLYGMWDCFIDFFKSFVFMFSCVCFIFGLPTSDKTSLYILGISHLSDVYLEYFLLVC